MREITVPLPGRSYPILIGSGALSELGGRMRTTGLRGALALVQDANVADRYGAPARRSLEDAGYRVHPVLIPPGEASKSLQQLASLYEALAVARLDRDSAIVAVGGGVVGDLAGFAAATYLRGIRFVQVPTTLLAQVDASVGGKTGIDLPAGKNLIGAFHQPSLVLIDLDTTATLPEPDFRAGIAEVIKYGVIADAAFLRHLESNREAILGHDIDGIEYIVARSCEIKAEIVGQDERESGLRAILNYGHTVGHAVETVAGYGTYLHGEAVAVGMAAASRLSVLRGWLAEGSMRRLLALLEAYGLPTRLREALPEGELMDAMRLDKKTRAGEFWFVLARELGRVETTLVTEEEAWEAVRSIQP